MSKVLSFCCCGWKYKGGRTALHLPHRPWSVSFSMGIRLAVPQDIHVTMYDGPGMRHLNDYECNSPQLFSKSFQSILITCRASVSMIKYIGCQMIAWLLNKYTAHTLGFYRVLLIALKSTCCNVHPLTAQNEEGLHKAAPDPRHYETGTRYWLCRSDSGLGILPDDFFQCSGSVVSMCITSSPCPVTIPIWRSCAVLPPLPLVWST